MAFENGIELRASWSCLRRQQPLKEHFGHCSRIAGLAWAGPDRLVTAGAGSKLGCREQAACEHGRDVRSLRCALLQWRLDTSRRKQEEAGTSQAAAALLSGRWAPGPF